MVSSAVLIVVALAAGGPSDDLDWDEATTPTFNIGGGVSYPFGSHIGGSYWLNQLITIDSSLSHLRNAGHEVLSVFLAGALRYGAHRYRDRMDAIIRVGAYLSADRTNRHIEMAWFGVAQLGFGFVYHTFSVEVTAGGMIGRLAGGDPFPVVSVTLGWVQW